MPKKTKADYYIAVRDAKTKKQVISAAIIGKLSDIKKKIKEM